MITFDQFQRYNTIGSICKVIEELNVVGQMKILEVGANAQKNLERFVKADIYYTDIEMIEGFEEDDHFFVADATNLSGMQDNEYDVVIASDVFEHIPQNQRKSFLTELYRVAKYAAIISFPFCADHVLKAEKRSNDYFKALVGRDQEWLIEHIENGLPERKHVEALLNNENIRFSVLEHGDIEIWEKLMKIHFFSYQYVELLTYCELIDQYYMDSTYLCDKTDRNYRAFYVLSKIEKVKTACDSFFQTMFTSDEMTDGVKCKINEMCQEVYQVASLRNLTYTIENKRNLQELIKQNQEVQRTEQVLMEQNQSLHQELQRIEQILMNQNQSLHNEVELYRSQLDQMRSSRYWRMTAPMRAVTSRIRKLIGREKGNVQCVPDVQTKKKYLQSEMIDGLVLDNENTKIVIILLLNDISSDVLKKQVMGVRGQSYKNWKLCLVNLQGTKDVREACFQQDWADDEKISYYERNREIEFSDFLCNIVTDNFGDYFLFMKENVFLHDQMLQAVVKMSNVFSPDILYTDELILDGAGKLIHPYYKPDWSPDLFYCENYIGNLFVINSKIADKIMQKTVRNDSVLYEIFLHALELTAHIFHFPYPLYSNLAEERRNGNMETEYTEKYLKRKYGDSVWIEKNGDSREVHFQKLSGQIRVSIIIPLKDKVDLTKKCVESILEKSNYSNYEILMLNNRSEQEETFKWFKDIQKRDQRVRVVDADFEFNWSKLNNYGIQHATGDVYIFLNNDTVVISPDWMELLVENVLREDVGVAGPMLLYEDDTIQHAGVIVGMGGWADHVYKGVSPDCTDVPFVLPTVSRNVLAVTGACLAISRKTIESIGEFNEDFIICGSDVEICLRAYKAGLNNVYVPKSKLYHLESKSRDAYIPPVDFEMSEKFYNPYREAGDPFFNDNLSYDNSTPSVVGKALKWDRIYDHIHQTVGTVR